MSFDKDFFRQKCKERLFHVRAKRVRERKIEEKVMRILRLVKAKSILSYVAMGHEPRLREVFAQRGHQNIFVPFMQAASFKMVKFRLPLKKKKFSIYEPLNSFFSTKIDVAIIPVIGVDGDFRRVGFGKGMYDRFFAKLPYRPLILFIQIEKCFTKKFVTDRFDVQGDILITPKEIIIRGDSDVGRAIGRKLCGDHKWRCRLFHGKKTRKREVQNL